MVDNRRILPGYEGVKFRAVRQDVAASSECRALYRLFREQGKRLGGYGMSPANGGNMSVRLECGFAITSSGCNLGCISRDDLVWVHRCDADREEVHYSGRRLPSSESILHDMIYTARGNFGSVVHAHDAVATSTPLAGLVPETAREEPYGTVALARIAVETFRADRRIIVLRNHGYVAIGASIDAAVDTIVAMHLRLLGS
jgi:ribulose-5-phosphate 4-epimerase/fuculose-1-phosphate aldolase